MRAGPHQPLPPQVDEASVQIQDPELRKVLSLTTADLRFADYLVKHVTENRDDVFLDGTGWEGGDEWIRSQFVVYLHSLLSSALQKGRDARPVSLHRLSYCKKAAGRCQTERFLAAPAQITSGCCLITAPPS